MLHETITISLARLENLESDSKDLIKAKALIERLRSENKVLKDEKRKMLSVIDNCKRHISIAGNAHKKYGVALVKSKLQAARLI